MSQYYTNWNPETGVYGVNKLNLEFRNPEGIVLAQKEVAVKEKVDLLDIKMNINSTLAKGTTYKLFTTATDLAGNTSKPEITEFTTGIEPPTNLYATDIRYSNFILHWTAAKGVTSYEVYTVKNNSYKLIGSTSLTQLVIDSLEMGKTYKYAIKSKVNNTTSNYSETVSVTTVKAEILGKETVCDPSFFEKVVEYSIDNFLPNTTAQWSTSNGNLEKVAVTENGKKATFKKKNEGICTVKAKLVGTPNILKKEVKISGVPTTSEIQIRCNKEIFEVLPNDFFSFIAEYSECYLDVPATLYTSAPNVLHARSVFDTSGNTQGTPTIGYEWRIKSGEDNWTIDPAYFNYIVENNQNLNLAPYSFLLVTYNSPLNNPIGSPPAPPVLEVRLHTECGASAWKEVGGFDVKDCGDSGFYSLLTPNGDGANDTFEIIGGKIKTTYRDRTVIPIYNLRIFNRQGEIVYLKENYMQDEERFTGIGNTGNYTNKELPEGTYFLTITGGGNNSGYIFLKRN